MIKIKDIKKLEKFYDEKSNTYIFKDDVTFYIKIEVEADINAGNIKAGNIKAWNIKAGDINAGDIKYYAICSAYSKFKCKSLVGFRLNAKAVCLDSKIFIEKGE